MGPPLAGAAEGQNVAEFDNVWVTVAVATAGTSIDLANLSAEVVAIGVIGEDKMCIFVVDTLGYALCHKFALAQLKLSRVANAELVFEDGVIRRIAINLIGHSAAAKVP